MHMPNLTNQIPIITSFVQGTTEIVTVWSLVDKKIFHILGSIMIYHNTKQNS